VPIQDLVDRTSGREMPVRMPSLQDLTELGRSPAVLLSEQQDLALDVFGRSVGMAIGARERSSTAFKPSASIRSIHL
jgi:hypothetical protein